MNGIGPKLPLFSDDRFGSHALVTSFSEEVKQNFKNLLLTSPGERIMNLDFGVGLKNFLFEPKEHAIPKIRQRLEGQISRYMPFVEINKIRFNDNINPEFGDDSLVLSILIEFEVPSLNLSTTLSIQSEDIS
jgi:phage baseplate assembly protein W